VQQFTTVSNITVPKVFQISYFATKQGAMSREERRLVAVIRGKMNSFCVSSVLPSSTSRDPWQGATSPRSFLRGCFM